MKRLILVRHAKSSWEHNVSDHQRPLSSKGFKDANNVSNQLIDQLHPDLVLSSDALRAKTTASIFMSNLNISPDIFNLDHNLYDFSGNNLLRVIKSSINSINELLVFGHNHAITSLANSYGNRYVDNVPTCGVVAMEFEIESWAEIKKGRTTKIVFPRDLK